MSWQIEFYEAEGRVPAAEFLDTLSKKDLVFVKRGFDRLEQYGPDLRRPQADYLRDDIYELRVNIESGTVRLFYFFYERRAVVITHGIRKKTDKVPPGEIDRAVSYRTHYLAAKGSQ